MKILSKSLIGCAMLSGVLGLTACQSTSMGQTNVAKHKAPAGTNQDHKKMQRLTEEQVVKVTSVANTGEILQARTALPNLQTEQARGFAQAMIEQHSQNEQQSQALANRLQLTPKASNTSNALQVDSNNMVTKLRQMSAPVDKDYIKGQIEVHTKVLMTIDKQLLPSTHNAELRDHLVKTRSAVAMHLNKAKEIYAMMR